MIQLKVKGVISVFDTRIPTQSELDTCKHKILTNELKWDPSGLDLDQKEETYENKNSDQLVLKRLRGGCQLFAMHRCTDVSAVLRYVPNTLQDVSLLEKLEEYVNMQLISRNTATPSAISKKQHNKTNPRLLASR